MKTPTALDALAAQVKQTLGAVDFVLVNAGFAKLVPFEQVTESVYDETFGVNTKGAFFTAQRLAPLVRDGGAFVFTTSVADETGAPGMSVYSGSKAAVRSFVRVLGAELVSRGIRVNAVAPGSIEFPGGMWEKRRLEGAPLYEEIRRQIPSGRLGEPEAVADVVLFLASSRARWVTGQSIVVDGGQLIGPGS